MPTLQFKGKNIIWNHHLAVPFHTLDEVPELHYFSRKAKGISNKENPLTPNDLRLTTDNMIIEGDNLIALKALLPQYAGRIKCIYIDPPYNTGNEGWVYNDKVNSPLINEWIGKEVGVDDLTRHDKWLCMISPRFKLLRDLLSEDGVIFISMDDNEQHRLRLILDEIFGEENFVANIMWQKKYAASNDVTGVAAMHDFIIMYQKTNKFNRNLFPRTEKQDKSYKNDDGDGRGLWRSDNLLVKTFSANSVFPIINPNTGKVYTPPKGSSWRGSKDTIEQWLNENRIFFGKDGKGAPQLKRYLTEVQQGVVPNTWWNFEYAGHNDAANKELTSILGEKKLFDTPKPTSLLKLVLQLSTDKNSIVLDSFAGSGTTMHAVMELNKEDGGNRKCIMVQMPENSEAEPDKNICKDITRERVKRAIDKYGYDSGFKYYRLGIPLDAETMLAGQLPTYQQFAKYIYYLCTGENLEAEDKINEADFYVGEYGKQAIYLVYKQDYETLTRLALNLTLAEKIKQQQTGKKRIVYAPSCFLDEEYLTDNQIEYVGIPYSLFSRNSQ